MRRWFAAVAAMFAAMAMIAFGMAAPSDAHTALKSATPGKGATVESPREIVLTFNDSVRLPRVIVSDEEGGTHQAGEAKAVGNEVTQPIGETLAAGAYTVGWRVVAADGHPVTGTYEFTVKETPEGASAVPTSDPAAQPTANETPAAASSAGEDGGGGSGWLWIGLGALVVFLLAGGGALLRRRNAEGTS